MDVILPVQEGRLVFSVADVRRTAEEFHAQALGMMAVLDDLAMRRTMLGGQWAGMAASAWWGQAVAWETRMRPLAEYLETISIRLEQIADGFESASRRVSDLWSRP